MTNPLAIQGLPPPPYLILVLRIFLMGLNPSNAFQEYLLCFGKHFLGFHMKLIYQLTICWHKLRFIAYSNDKWMYG